MSLAAPPDVVRFSPRSGDASDCVVAALEAACGVSYEEALAASMVYQPDVLETGMYWDQVQKAAKRLGFKTHVARSGRYDIDDETGILYVYRKLPGMRKREHHVVYLWDGRIIEPQDGRRQLWLDPRQFLTYYGYRAGSLLVVEEKT